MARRRFSLPLKPLAWTLFGVVVTLAVASPWLLPKYHALRAWDFSRRAEASLAAKEFNDARLLVTNALRHDPKRSATWELLARLHRAAGEPGAAEAQTQAWLRATNQLDLAVTALDDILTAGNLPLGSALVPELTAQFDDVRIWQRATVIHAQAGRHDEALAALDRALRLDPTNRASLVSRAALLCTSPSPGQMEKGRAALEGFRQDPELFVSATTTLAASYDRTDPARALALEEEILQREPGQWHAVLRRTLLRARLKLAGHEDDLARAWPEADTPLKRLDLLRTTRLIEGDAGVARALDRFPAAERNHSAVAFFELGALASQNSWDDVHRLCTRHLETELDPLVVPQFLAWRFRAASALGRVDESARDYEALTRAVGSSAPLASATATLLEAWNFPAQAATLYHLGGRRTGPAGDLDLLRAFAIAQRTGDSRLSLAIAEDILKRTPASPLHQNNVAACLLALNEQLPRALQLTERVTAAPTPPPEFLETHALALTLNQRPADALPLFAALPAVLQTQATVRVHHALALALTGRPTDARALVQGIDPASLTGGDRLLLDRIPPP